MFGEGRKIADSFIWCPFISSQCSSLEDWISSGIHTACSGIWKYQLGCFLIPRRSTGLVWLDFISCYVMGEFPFANIYLHTCVHTVLISEDVPSKVSWNSGFWVSAAVSEPNALLLIIHHKEISTEYLSGGRKPLFLILGGQMWWNQSVVHLNASSFLFQVDRMRFKMPFKLDDRLD